MEKPGESTGCNVLPRFSCFRNSLTCHAFPLLMTFPVQSGVLSSLLSSRHFYLTPYLQNIATKTLIRHLSQVWQVGDWTKPASFQHSHLSFNKELALK